MFIYYLLFSFVLGSVVGSGVLCMSERIVDGREWLKGRSCCDLCGHPLSFLDMIPVFSYLFLKGKCRYCGCRIAKRYWISECMMGCLYLLIAWKTKESYIDAFKIWGLCAILLCVSIVDIKSYIIPDPCILLGIAWFFECEIIQKDGQGCMASFVFASSSLLLFTLITWITEKCTKKECLGGGDLKLLFMMDLYLGFEKGMVCILISCLSAVLYMVFSHRKLIPFAPFLSLGCVLSILFTV